ncbi:MAG TPA: hypothetical protein VM571_00055 [Noviherbaspirillum sp.]|nr:hypothetical protein [Noviherbaspirillum sp.]
MQNTQLHPAPGKAAPRLAAFVGAAGFTFSLLLSGLMLLLQGNPGFLIIWLLAAMAMAAFTRWHYRWQQACKRLSDAYPPAPVRAVGSTWRGEVVDVVFREMPNKCSAL